jgi:GDPmannose 4,6-dehydratase
LKRAIITGVSGQDGILLAELLLNKNYEVLGLISARRADKDLGYIQAHNNFRKVFVNYENPNEVSEILNSFAPHEFYNLVAASSVKDSFGNPFSAAEITGMIPIRLLEAIRNSQNFGNIKFYQASSSEMFGNGPDILKNEDSLFYPNSPYAISKLFAHQSCRMYREVHGMFVSCGILFNHESILRPDRFVTRKITREVARIATGKKDKMVLGSLYPRRDWGFAGDYVNAMWLMLQQDTPDDFVIATGISHSILDFASMALEAAGLMEDPMIYIEEDVALTRPLEINGFAGDASKAKELLGWNTTVDLKELIRTMVEFDLKLELEI